jgi:hypothetical protein
MDQLPDCRSYELLSPVKLDEAFLTMAVSASNVAWPEQILLNLCDCMNKNMEIDHLCTQQQLGKLSSRELCFALKGLS